MFHKRVYANDRLWLEGSFGTMSACVTLLSSRMRFQRFLYLREYRSRSSRRKYVHISDSSLASLDFQPPKPGHCSCCWLCNLHRTAPTWAYLCCCISNGHPVYTRHLQPRVRVMNTMVCLQGDKSLPAFRCVCTLYYHTL
jgi:hypothetical protein